MTKQKGRIESGKWLYLHWINRSKMSIPWNQFAEVITEIGDKAAEYNMQLRWHENYDLRALCVTISRDDWEHTECLSLKADMPAVIQFCDNIHKHLAVQAYLNEYNENRDK